MTTFQDAALRLMAETPMIDGHNDWANTIRGYYHNQLNDNFDEENTLIGHVDLKRLIEGRSGGVFLSAYVDCPEDESDRSTENHFQALLQTLQQIDLIHRLVKRYESRLVIAKNSSDIMKIFHRGQITVLISIEGLHQIGNSFSVLRNYYRLGVRCATLAHNKNNTYAGSATSKLDSNRGLTNEGKKLVQEMNQLGMIVDLSHTSETTALDALHISTAPVVFTHSSCAAIVPHVRNVTDKVLVKLKSNRGLLMVSLIPTLTATDPSTATVTNIVDHMQHTASLIGYEHVGIGSDFDGMSHTVIGLEDVSKYPALVVEMLKRGIREHDIRSVLGENIIRVFRRVEEESTRLQNIPVTEDVIEPMWPPELMDWCRAQWPMAKH